MPVLAQKSPTPSVAVGLVLITLLLGWSGTSVLAQEEAYNENSVKAAFIYHFSTFVVWPETAASNQDFVIAVVGDDKIAEALDKYLPGRSIQGRPMHVRRLDSIEELRDEAVLFIGAGSNRHLAEQIAAVSNRPLLVVTDGNGALSKGSMINFRVVDRRVRFEISLGAAENAGLVLSSRLLSAAMYVDTTSAILSLPAIITASNEYSAAGH